MVFTRLAGTVTGRIVGPVGRQLVSVSILDMATRLAAQAFLAALPMLFAIASFTPPAIRRELVGTLRTQLGTEGPVLTQVDEVYRGAADSLETWGAIGVLVALLSATAFSRALQRLCERAWHLPRAGLRTVVWRWGVWLLVWVTVLVSQGTLRDGFGAGTALGFPLQLIAAVLMWWWTQHLLLAGRMAWLPLLPGALLTGIGVVLYSAVSGLWLPRSLELSVERYGPLGSVFTVLSWLIFFFAIVAGGIAIGYVLAHDALLSPWLGLTERAKGGTPGGSPAGGDAPARSTNDHHAMEPTTRGQRWSARGALAAAAAAVLVLGVFAGLRTIALLGVGLAGLAVMAAALWWVLTRRSVGRLFAAVLAVAAPVWVVVAYTRAHLAWVVVVAGALLMVAAGAGRRALVGDGGTARTPEHPAPRVRHPVLIMNPRSGGGKVERFGLREKAEVLGAQVLLLEGPGETDVAELARKAASEGADLLGVAGGDGTQALVADVAASLDLPFLVVPAGTRNHFALDLGLDREDPAKALDALADGVLLRVDLGRAAGHPFVNNVSFGAYAEVVQSPAYRDGKTRTTLELLPDLLVGHRGARLAARAGEADFEAPQALLVSNNPYGTGDIAGLGRRPRLDGGELGVVGVDVASAAQAAGLLRGRRATGLTRATAREVVVGGGAPGHRTGPAP
ncbi:YhjD/YihY/BrkB family envelope integrity protein, partial [Streptomyces sp. NPDC059517]|uniref:YhjD/YihY/BrkB family envelope integrity protein n=1 Tax=Streptomyces sp. NPDC059517 TaxID=3346855 RepID=UPI0036A14F2A